MSTSQNPYEIVNAIKDPIQYLDTLGNGKLANDFFIDSITRKYYGATNKYFFQYNGVDNQLSSILFIPDRHPLSCAGLQLLFEYNNQNQIQTFTEVSPSSGCYLIYRRFQFNYFPSGALKSIIQRDSFNIYEQYFEYGTNKRISKIYLSGRRISEKHWGYGIMKYEYDGSGNVAYLLRKEGYAQNYTDSVRFIYDSTVNPYKSIVKVANHLPDIMYASYGPLFLSYNNVRRAEHYFISTPQPRVWDVILKYTNGRYGGLKYGDNDEHHIHYR